MPENAGFEIANKRKRAQAKVDNTRMMNNILTIDIESNFPAENLNGNVAQQLRIYTRI